MGFRDLFKVRKPGNGSAFESKVKAAIKTRRAQKFPSTDRTENSGGKKPVK